jgi:hypothetical protein
MTRFQHVFRRDRHKDRTEHRFNDADGEPHVDRRLIEGETLVIRGVELLVRRDGDWAGTPRFIGALVVEPNDP